MPCAATKKLSGNDFSAVANIDKATLDGYKVIGEGKSAGSIPPATYLQVNIARYNSSNLTLLRG
jgi:hypothetical protein